MTFWRWNGFFPPVFYATPQPLAKVVRVVWTINDYHLRMFVYHWNARRNTSTDPNKSPTKCNPFKHMKATLVYPNLHTYNPLKPKTYPFQNSKPTPKWMGITVTCHDAKESIQRLRELVAGPGLVKCLIMSFIIFYSNPQKMEKTWRVKFSPKVLLSS